MSNVEIIDGLSYNYSIHKITENFKNNTTLKSIVYVFCDHNNTKLYCGETQQGFYRLWRHIQTLTDSRGSKFNNREKGWESKSSIKSPSEYNDKWTILIFDCTNWTKEQRVKILEVPLHDKYASLVSHGGHYTGDSENRLGNPGNTKIYGELHQFYKIDPWLTNASSVKSIKTWSYLPELYNIWLKHNNPNPGLLQHLANKYYNLNIETKLINMVNYFKGCPNRLQELLVNHGKTDFALLMSN
ncbi:hypothetical protein [Ralstonia phage RP13]|nr:hypothetical protein [Ralstonia phage RP13]